MDKSKSTLDTEMKILLVLTGVKLLLHLYVNTFAGYGIFRDELYYLACANHIGIGYVDHPPFSIFILSVWRTIFGDSVFAIRLFSALAGAATVFMSGLIVRRLGGRTFAIALTGIAAICAPILLAMFTLYSMNSIDILLWSVIAHLLLKMIREDKPRDWILLGVLVGIGLLNKISMGWLAFGILAGFLATKKRHVFLTPWPYISGLIALIIFSPFIIWNLTHDFAHLEFMRNAVTEKYIGVSAFDFLAGQFVAMGPLAVIIWLLGVYYFLFDKIGMVFRILGIALLTVTLILVLNGHSKPEYLAPAVVIGIAAGAVLLERWFTRKSLAWLKIVLPALIVVCGIAMAPMATPILPVETFISYSKAVGFIPESNEGLELTELPQFYADMFGWENMARTVSDVYMSLSPEERATTIVLGTNYGEAGTIDYYRKKYPLPAVMAPHNNYWFWSEEFENKDITTLIFIQREGADPYRFADDVVTADTVKSRYAINYENNRPVMILRNLKMTIRELREAYHYYI